MKKKKLPDNSIDMETKIIKRNFIRIAKHHRDHCEDSECGVQLFLLLLVGRKAGFEFTEEERKCFF